MWVLTVSSMRRIYILMLAGLVMLAACSGQDHPPDGRWIGHMDTPDVMVVAWLEFLEDGTLKVSAPDILGVGNIQESEKTRLHARLSRRLLAHWSEVEPRRMDFDGRVFRKPGGIAPQIEWDPDTRDMKLVFYFGLHKSIRIRMRQVSDFRSDPWLSPK